MTAFDFSKIPNVTLIICPVDMRSGFASLAQYAQSIAEIDVELGQDIVVFISRNRRLVKAIHTDAYGRTLITFASLAQYAQSIAEIDVELGQDIVVFISRNRRLVKAIHTDAYGRTLITRRLRAGSFEKFLVRQQEQAKVGFTAEELEKFLNGEALMVQKETFF